MTKVKITSFNNLESATQTLRVASTAKARRRVLMVGMHLTKTRGGISTATREILNSSLREDFEFEYIASQAEDFGKYGKAWLALTALLQFAWNCVFRRPEKVYVHLGSNASLYRESMFIVLAKVFGLKTIAHFQAGDIDYYFPYQSRFGQWFIRRAIGSSDCLIAVSGESARQLRELVGAKNRIVTVPNGIETEDFDFPLERRNEQPKLLFVGAIGKLKGEKDLIRALEILRTRRPDLDLRALVLGYGAENLTPLYEQAGIADWIEFSGPVSFEERLDFYRRADIFVLPTYAEALPLSVIEGMAAGLPVVSTNVGGIPELVENGRNGFLVQPADATDLAAKLETLLDDKKMRLAFGKVGQAKARTQYDIRCVVEQLRGILSASL